MNRKIKICLPIVFLSLCVVLNFNCLTAEAVGGGYLSGYEEVQPQPSAISWWSTFAYLISLVAVFAVVVVMAYFAAKFIGGRFNSARMAAGGGKILENLPLGPNRSVCIVELAGRVFLLGVTDGGITLLDTITDNDMIEHLHEQSLAANDIFYQDFGSFSDLVKKIPPIFKKK